MKFEENLQIFLNSGTQTIFQMNMLIKKSDEYLYIDLLSKIFETLSEVRNNQQNMIRSLVKHFAIKFLYKFLFINALI